MRKTVKIEDVSSPVTLPGKNGTYQKIEVVYLQEGEDEPRTLNFVSFSAPGMMKILPGLQGKTVDVEIAKNEQGFWTFTKVYDDSEPAPKSSGKGNGRQSGGKVVGNTYETPQERGLRQLFTTRRGAVSVVLEAFGKLPSTKAEWKKVGEACKEVENIVMRGYVVNPDDTIARITDEVQDEETE